MTMGAYTATKTCRMQYEQLRRTGCNMRPANKAEIAERAHEMGLYQLEVLASRNDYGKISGGFIAPSDAAFAEWEAQQRECF